MDQFGIKWPQTMKFVGYNELYRDTLELVKRLSRPVVAVYGVPRSGMLPASIIASILHIPLGTVGDKGLKLLPSGNRKQHIPKEGIITHLVVDDSLSSGSAMNLVKERIKQGSALYGAVYIQEGRERFIDVYGRVLPENRVFAWNVLNSAFLSHCCVDIDGVVCLDPVGTSEDQYRQFIEHATPLSCPLYPVGAFVSGRSKDYEQGTAQWLKKQGIEYKELVLHPGKRGQIDDAATFKARFYKSSHYELFIESHASLAQEIATLSGKPVLAVDNMTLYEGSRASD